MKTAAPTLAYRDTLTDLRDPMIDYLVAEHIDKLMAEAMIDQWWDRLVAFIVKDKRKTPAEAAAILNEALGFLRLIAEEPEHGPSETVDIGFHALIIYSMEFAALSHALAGRYIHHLPTDVKGFNEELVPTGQLCKSLCGCIDGGKGGHLTTLTDTVAAMQARGPVDLTLWVRGPDLAEMKLQLNMLIREASILSNEIGKREARLVGKPVNEATNQVVY